MAGIVDAGGSACETDVMLDTPGLRQPQQVRSRLTLQRVLDAGEQVLARDGYDGMTIAEVCRVAETSAGAVYTRFESKDALARAVHDHVMGRMQRDVTALYTDDPEWAELPTPRFIERAVAVLTNHFRSNAGIIRAVVLRAAVDPVMRASGAQSVRTMADAFTTRLLERAGEYPHPDPEQAVRGVFGMAFEAVSWDVAFGAEFREAGALGSTPDERLPAICRLVLLTPPD